MSQEASSVITEYLLDTQPGLAKVIASTTGGNTTRFVHDPMGIHSQENSNGDWLHIVKDGLGSVRQVFGDNLSELYAAEYAPYGEVWNSSGTEQTPFAFTGEMLDDNGLQYHRARYLDPNLGVWMSLDPLETANRYGYVDGNPVNAVDPSGLCTQFNNQRGSTIPEIMECYRRRAQLDTQYGILLTTEEGVDPEKWTYERIKHAIEALDRINITLGSLTRQAVGDVELRLVQGPAERNEPANAQSCNRVDFYLNSSRGDNFVHPSTLIIHELGHVLTLDSLGRTRGSESVPDDSNQYRLRPVVLWENIQTQVLDANANENGWKQFILRENPSSDNAEQVADMFMFYIMQKSGNDDYEFDTDTVTGQARLAFMEGNEIRRGRTGEIATRVDGSEITSAGLGVWANKANCPTPQSYSPGIMAKFRLLMNGGFCTV